MGRRGRGAPPEPTHEGDARPRRRAAFLEPEDLAGQVLTFRGGHRYRIEADGSTTPLDGAPPLEVLEARWAALDAEITAAMSDPELGRNPHGNPYKRRED